METSTLPGRASDAGPDNSAPINRQSLYSLYADDTIEAVRALDRLYRDDRAIEKRERIAKIDEALEALRKMREVA